MIHYTLYGLGLASDLPLPSLRAAEHDAGTDIRVYFSSPPTEWDRAELRPWAPPAFVENKGEIGYGIWRDDAGRFYRFRYQDKTEFLVDSSGIDIWVRWPAGLTREDAVTYLIGPIIGFILRLRGRLCLHASCVVSGDAAFALLGSQGAGKSTTATAFAQLGLPVLSDDITALAESGDDFMALPGYPRLCLWPRSAEALYGDVEALRPITPNWEKRHVDLSRHPGGFPVDPVPLEMIYILGDRSDDEGTPHFTDVDSATGVVALVGHTYANRLLDAGMRATEFASLDRLVRRVPIRKVIPPAGFDRLGELCRALLEDFARAASGHPA